MFGAGNEPSTVEEFKAMFPDEYYAYSAGEIKSAGVNKIVSKDSNSDVLAEMNIPAAVLALPGYGWSAGTAKNWVDWENKKYHQEVGQVDLGDLNWIYRTNLANPRFDCNNPPIGIYDNRQVVTAPNLVCARFVPSVEPVKVTNFVDKTIGTYTKNILVFDSSYTDATAFKAAMAGVKLNYELETPIETDISALIDDNTIEVESGGSLTFENTNGDSYRIPVPSSLVTMEKP
jgi:hypothetical protein